MVLYDFKPLGKGPHRVASVADRGFFFRREFRHGFAKTLDKEQRVIAEAISPTSFCGNSSVALTVEFMGPRTSIQQD